jgi:hypothetical protein
MPWPVSVTESSTAEAASSNRAATVRRRRTPAHGLLGVQNQVQQRLLNLAGVCNYRRQPRLIAVFNSIELRRRS